jgi:hypothetical protein
MYPFLRHVQYCGLTCSDTATQIISEEVSNSLTHSPVTKTYFLSSTARLMLPTAQLKQLSEGRISYLV